ncbi:uncharacterized protein LOC134834053 [Culicoides brevitarsis]|uniref:uncharacterized protein LOC134834053 n=1 Tax=Culicoides brevitarsis TaxID=469753 RepID=UPI00307B3DA1
MFLKLLTFLAIIGLSLASPVVEERSPAPLKADVIVVNDIREFRAANPSLNLVELKRSANQPRLGIRYTLGSRLAGDVLVATLGDFVSYSVPQNVKLTLTYPTNGYGAVVTHVLVDVQQSSSFGSGYVVGGGIGQRFIQIVIEAQSTTYFGYSAYVYGL